MATITAGNAAIDRASQAGAYPEGTTIEATNPASATGVITKFEIWVWIVTYYWMKLGTFSGSGGTWTNRDHVDVGQVNPGSKQTFSGIECDVIVGDCIGFYGSCGNPSMIEADTGGSAKYIVGDRFEAGQVAGYSSWGNTISLYAEGQSYDVPTVTTQAVTDIEKTACTGNGNVTHDGAAACTERGVCYCLRSHGDPNVSDTKEEAAAGNEGAFTVDVTGLEPATWYNMRAYATNVVGTAYGETVEFMSLIAGSYVEVLTADRALALDNTTAFTPDSDYEPATKKYVDDAVIVGSGADGGEITEGNNAAIILDLGTVNTILDLGGA